MLQLRGCPKCGGALREESDRYGPYSKCMQCGYLKNDPEEPSSEPLPRVNPALHSPLSPDDLPRPTRTRRARRRVVLTPWTMWY